jgi:CRISPR/Cas system CSM-associated protein Csm3 (group 7 of RAMP superfamily)
MGRPLRKRYEIRGRLVAETPIHVGGGNDDVILDMPLAVDGKGHFYLPGTSLTGPMRAWWARVFSDSEAELVFGRIAHTATDEGHASFVFVSDAPLAKFDANDVGARVLQETRDGVGIDRRSGTAADGIKYDRATLPRGAAFEFSMTLELPARANRKNAGKAEPVVGFLEMIDALPRRIGALLKALEAGSIRFGGAKTRGLGRLQLVGAEVLETDLGSRDGILAVLKGAQRADRRTEWVNNAKSNALDLLEIRIRWRPTLPTGASNTSIGLRARCRSHRRRIRKQNPISLSVAPTIPYQVPCRKVGDRFASRVRTSAGSMTNGFFSFRWGKPLRHARSTTNGRNNGSASFPSTRRKQRRTCRPEKIARDCPGAT